MFNARTVLFSITFSLAWLTGCSATHYGEIHPNNVKVKFISKKEGLPFYLVSKIKSLESPNVSMSKTSNSSDISKLLVNARRRFTHQDWRILQAGEYTLFIGCDDYVKIESIVLYDGALFNIDCNLSENT
ncbi:hypothetical protein AltI4_18620 [Alteromonas sp. I4]|jgi:hypothetical protein|nr:hypothetical protein AltI4_18620 [Alteromonas sp. I4]HCV04481.1 hypothetical protein [Pseudoalteromonas sp.]|tara:strand:- start:14639 stop:15028 length:390 start_codon:yes stop_codon:yes gene_type:complete